MAFLTSYRAEKIYFEKLRSNIDIAKSYIQRGATDEVMALLQNAVDADGAIMLCYRNLGEVWADLAAQLEKTQKALEDLKVALEEYHDDLNNKIDGINNYLVRLINALDERVTILENESKVKFAYLNYDSVEDVYSIQYNGETADFDALSAALEYPHLLVVIDNDSDNIYYPRSVSDVLIDFHADGVSGSDYVDISVTMTDSDVVTVTEKTVINYTFGTGFNVSNTNEVTPDLTVLQAKLTARTGIDIDSNNEISADFSEVQAKLSAGFGIDIDANNEISVDTNDVQEKLIAGQNITLTPDSTDPTKTVIAASGGSSSFRYLKGDMTTDSDFTNVFSSVFSADDSSTKYYIGEKKVTTQKTVDFDKIEIKNSFYPKYGINQLTNFLNSLDSGLHVFFVVVRYIIRLNGVVFCERMLDFPLIVNNKEVVNAPSACNITELFEFDGLVTDYPTATYQAEFHVTFNGNSTDYTLMTPSAATTAIRNYLTSTFADACIQIREIQ